MRFGIFRQSAAGQWLELPEDPLFSATVLYVLEAALTPLAKLESGRPTRRAAPAAELPPA